MAVPENVRPHLPQDVRDRTAAFIAAQLSKNPSDFDTAFAKVPPDIMGDVWAKLADRMSWFKRAQSTEELKDHFERILGLGKYKPYPSKFKKKKRKEEDMECCHSLDPHCDGGDDGW